MIPIPYQTSEQLTQEESKTVLDMIAALKGNKTIANIIRNNIASNKSWSTDSAATAKQAYSRFVASHLSSRENLVTKYIRVDNPLYIWDNYLNNQSSDVKKEVAIKLLLLYLTLKTTQIKCQVCKSILAPKFAANETLLALDTEGYQCILCKHKNLIHDSICTHITKMFTSEESATMVTVDDFLSQT